MKKMLLLILIAAGLAAFYHSRTGGGPTAADGTLTLYGNVDIRETALGFRVAGRLAGLNYEEGDRVETGAVLAWLDPKPFEEELAVRRALIGEIEAGLLNAEKTYARRDQLVKRGSAPVSDYDEALAQRDELKAKLVSAKAQLAQAETSQEDATLLAPNNGVILTRVREPGSIMPVGTVVYTLALDRPVWVRAYIDEPRLGLIRPGQRARVRTDSGGVYEAQIGFISPQAEFTPKTVETTQLRTDLVYRLRVVVDQPDQGLRQGMPVTVELWPPRAE